MRTHHSVVIVSMNASYLDHLAFRERERSTINIIVVIDTNDLTDMIPVGLFSRSHKLKRNVQDVPLHKTGIRVII